MGETGLESLLWNNDELEKLNPISLAGERSGEKKPRVLLKYGMATEFRSK